MTPGGDVFADIGRAFEDANRAVNRAADQVGGVVGRAGCSLIPPDMKRALVRTYRDNADLFDAPWFSLVVGPYPSMILEMVESCNVTTGVRRAACDLSRNCDIILAIAPFGAALGTVLAAPIVPAIGIYTGLVAVMSPICRSMCQQRLPNLGDCLHVATALGTAITAVQTGSLGPAMDLLGKIGADAAGHPGSVAEGAQLSAERAMKLGPQAARAEAAASSRARGREAGTTRARLEARAAVIEAQLQAGQQPQRSSTGPLLALGALGALAFFAGGD